MIDCDWNQYLDHEGECEECDGTCTSGCTNGDVCYECHASCRTCTGHAVDECVDCWCGAERDVDGCCMCDSASGFKASGDKCQQTGCFSNGCDACSKGQCIHCAYGFNLYNGECWECREQDCDDIAKVDLPLCQENGIRHDAGMCNCYASDMHTDDYDCRVCSMGCDECFVDGDGNAACDLCSEGYIQVMDMPHLCAFLQDESYVPMGYVQAHGSLFNSGDYTALFDFDLTNSA